jgi:hypothetical protein
MEAFKIENYEREHGAGTFVPFRPLSQKEAEHIFRLIKLRLQLPDELDAIRVLDIIRDKSIVVKGVDATRDGFDLKHLLNQLKLDNADTVLLNWYRFDNIDELRTHDLCQMFSDIWQRSSDDLQVFNSNVDWVLSIEHHGAVSFLRFARED